MTLQENITKLEEKELALKKYPNRSFEKIYVNGDLVVWQDTHHQENGDKFIQLISSYHWTYAVILRYDSLLGGDPKWDISYESGSTISADAGDIAEAAKVVFARAETIIKTHKQ